MVAVGASVIDVLVVGAVVVIVGLVVGAVVVVVVAVAGVVELEPVIMKSNQSAITISYKLK